MVPVRSAAFSLVAVLLLAAPAAASRYRLDAAAPPPPVPVVYPDLSSFRVVTVTDLDVGSTSRHGPAVAAELADQIAARLQERALPGLEIRRGAPLGEPGELVLSGTVAKATAGSRAGRYFVGPLAAATVALDLRLSESDTGRAVDARRIKRTWGMPGIAGTVKGLPFVVKRTAERTADWLAEARAAHPPAGYPLALVSRK